MGWFTGTLTTKVSFLCFPGDVQGLLSQVLQLVKDSACSLLS